MNLQFFAEDNALNNIEGLKLRNTKNIRYSQKSINPEFGDNSSINELIAHLKTNSSYANQVDPIRIAKFRSLPLDIQNNLRAQGVSEFSVFSLDNRRLYAAKTAGVDVYSRWATQADLNNPSLIRRFSTNTAGKSIKVR